jgi:hypothetical protein
MPPARVEVELDVFSGRPNPTWVLTTGEAEAFERRLAALPRIPDCVLSAALGYRGLIARTALGAETQSIWIQSGCVRIAEGDTPIHARDDGRALERWLLGTGRPRLGEKVMGIVDPELR